LDHDENTGISGVTRCVLRAYNSAKCECGRGSTPDPAGGAYGAPQTPWLVLRGPARRGRGTGRGREGKSGRGRKRQERGSEGGERKGEEGGMGPKLEQGRRLAKAVPGCFEVAVCVRAKAVGR